LQAVCDKSQVVFKRLFYFTFRELSIINNARPKKQAIMSENYSRLLVKNLKNALDNRRIVIVSGARQAGKTTLTEQIKAPGLEYRTLDDTDLLDFALADPKGFIKTSAKTLVIDEIQKVPRLIPEIKMVVDKNNRNGQFLLTGSVNL
jgi:predicted AAA+ superfamily ATPase